jgi:type II secretory pathway predicted ATPase ExeA
MYQAYWGLKYSPFAAAATREAFVASPSQAEALARLDFLLESRGSFGLLLGPAGSGKSGILAEFQRRATRAGASTVVCGAAAADESYLLAAVAGGMGIFHDDLPSLVWRQMADRLAELRLEGRTAIILLDDLDRATPGGLALVERLLHLPAGGAIVVGSARRQTASRIGQRLIEQVALRIELEPWSEGETGEFLRTSLARAGRLQPAFDAAAVRRLFELSGGAPRRVNRLAELALLAGAGQNLVQIDADTIEAVEEELSGVH